MYDIVMMNVCMWIHVDTSLYDAVMWMIVYEMMIYVDVYVYEIVDRQLCDRLIWSDMMMSMI